MTDAIAIDVKSQQPAAGTRVFEPNYEPQPSLPSRILVVLALTVVTPLQLWAVFISSLDVVVATFGLYVVVFIVAMLSRYTLSELRVRRELHFTALLVGTMSISILTALFVGYNLSYWSLYGGALTVPVTNLRRPLKNITSDSHLHLYDLSHSSFRVSDRHIGQKTYGERIFCSAPIYTKGGLARKIGSPSDIPLNWAVCISKPVPVSHLNFSCSDYFQQRVLDHDDPRHFRDKPEEEFYDTSLLECLRGWASYERGYDLEQVSTQDLQLAMQAVKDSLEDWTPLEQEIENPLAFFDDDEDIAHLSYIVMVSTCCSSLARGFAWKTIAIFLSGSALWVFFVLHLWPHMEKIHFKIMLVLLAILCSIIFLLFTLMNL